MKTDASLVYLKDYQPHSYKITHSDLVFDLDPTSTVVTATHEVARSGDKPVPLVLDCEKMEILSVHVADNQLGPGDYIIDDNTLTINDVPDQFSLTISNRIDPSANTQLSGLYQSGDMLCTQCEAEGFRRITPSIDRPDNLATYRVTLNGSQQHYPITLCNGNLIEQRKENGSHTTVWHDPFPKPTYLFAVVAGNLSVLQDSFTTMNDRKIDLRFYARDSDIDKCEYAMGALKRSMEWDEQIYGREYDLELFNVVAVSDFNMGAMENKSLNIFNTKYVLADLETATDTDFNNVERVIAHEYFHNWSGNRVTCRDWFQLSLKEGFTVFRDQEFSADMGSRGVQRIGDVNVLRNHQFPEDAGPMAHPVRPESYSEINNFYTVTIYEKGAEVVRMLHTLAGREAFRRGTDLYFQRHDGQAVTTDDFIAAISDASGLNLEQFKNWYRQAGTPEVKVQTEYDAGSASYKLTFNQSCPPTPGQSDKQPFVIPITLALLDHQGGKMNLASAVDEQLIVLDQPSQIVSYDNITTEPVPSLLRGFTSPVKLNIDLSPQQLAVIFNFDDDPFNRWQAGQRLFEQCILDNAARLKKGAACRYDDELVTLFGQVLIQGDNDFAFSAKLLSLPGEAWLGELSKPVDPKNIAEARKGLQQKLASHHYQLFSEKYAQLQKINTGELTPEQMAARSLRDLCLGYLSSLDTHNTQLLAQKQLADSRTMTDRVSAMAAILDSTSPDRDKLIADFYSAWQHEALVVDKWFRLQAMARRNGVLKEVECLTDHPAFDRTNPNKVYALILAYTHGNPSKFHNENGEGYRFLSKWVKIMDPINPQVAARLVSGFNGWRNMLPSLANQMQQCLEEILAAGPLSPDVSEIISRALAPVEES